MNQISTRHDSFGRRAIFFVDYSKMTSMTHVRSMLPARLRRARLATIARDAVFRRYFASGDDSATIRGILKQMAENTSNINRHKALERRLEREARSRRAIVGARKRRYQVAQQALAPVVEAVSRGQRLANRQARMRAVNLIRRRQRAFRAAREPVGADLPLYYYNAQRSRV